MSQKIIHVCRLDKFIPPFIDLLEENFMSGGHYFWLDGDHERFKVKQNKSTYKVKANAVFKIRGYLRLFRLLKEADKVILHGLLDVKVVIVLFLMPWHLHKCYWIIWGADLYTYKLSKRTWKWKIKEFFRRSVIKDIGYLLTYIPGDVDLARKWYGAKGAHCECLMYTSNIVDQDLMTSLQSNIKKEVCDSTKILIGNSADPNNNHIESLRLLLSYKDNDIKIYAPLSYGDKKYAKMVSDVGKNLFGDKFIPVFDFMTHHDYVRFLKKIDVAIFNHERQQAMGNIITLLGLGKKIYIRKKLSHYNYLKSLGCHLYDISDLSLEKLGDLEAMTNSSIISGFFSKKNLINQLAKVFNT